METYKNGAPFVDAADLRALRHADRVGFRFSDGEYSIIAVRDRENTRDGFEQTVRIQCNGKVRDYGGERWGTTDNEYKHCNELISTPSQTETWQTILSQIRVGDTLGLEWMVSGNGYTKDYGLYMDSLNLVINRQSGDKSKRMVFTVRTSVCPDNTARMIRRHLW